MALLRGCSVHFFPEAAAGIFCGLLIDFIFEYPNEKRRPKMLKRKVSAILVLILAVITAFACAFAADTCIRRNRQMSAPKAKEIGKFRFLNDKSDAEGVSFEVIGVREVGSDVVLDLLWVNNSGNPIEYGKAYELYRLKEENWKEIDTELFFPDVCYSINSGSVGGISYTIPGHVDMTAGERYRLQTEFRFQNGDEYSEPLKNLLVFEIVKAAEYIPKESYAYRSEHGFATLCLDPDNKTFSLMLSLLSSYWPHGRYTETDGYIVCKADDETGNTYTFRRENETLVFEAGRSSQVPVYRYGQTDKTADSCVPDGAVFRQGLFGSEADVPSLRIKLKADTEIENDEFLAALCSCDWTVPTSDGSGQMINTNVCGPGIGAEINLPEANISLPAEAALQFDTQPDTVTVKCLKKGNSIEDICNIDRSDGNYSFSLKNGEYVYRITAEWQNGDRAEYGFAACCSTTA